MTPVSAAKNLGLTRRFVQPVVEATRTVLSEFLQVQVESQAISEFHLDPVSSVHTAIDVQGAGHGRLVVSMSDSLACRLAGMLLFQQFDEVDAMVLDFVGELTNMIGGCAKKQLDFLGFRLGLPEVTSTSAVRGCFPEHSVPITLTFQCGGEQLHIHAGFVGEAAAEVTAAATTEAGHVPRLLMIDDDPMVVKILTRMLGRQYDVAAVDSLHDGLRQLETLRPDVVLADIHTPDWNGVEFIKAVRTSSNSQVAQTAVVMLSGDETRDTTLAAFDAGADDYIRKNDFTRVALLGKIQRAIELRRQRISA